VHLAAAGLSGGEVDGVSEALEDADDGLPGGGEEGVVIAGDEERDAQVASPSKAGGISIRIIFHIAPSLG
jgi:hypothetical protein